MSKEEKQIKEITDNDLDTGRDLVTENYQLEILTLKDKVDLRRFSRAFLKVDKLLKNIFSNKLDKGLYGGNAQNLKNEIDTKVSKNGDTVNGKIIVERNITSADYHTGQIELQCNAPNTGGMVASLGFHNLGKNAHSIQLKDDWAGLKIISQGGSTFGNMMGIFYDIEGGVVYSPYNKPTPNDIGAISKAGDTMTGTLYTPKLISTRPNSGSILASSIPGFSDFIGTDVVAGGGYMYYVDPTNNKHYGFRTGRNGVRPSVLDGGIQYKLYHEGYKPTKADVGLDLVNNWDASSAVNDPSNSTYATVGGVKKAYDRGTEGINIANTKIPQSGNVKCDVTMLTESWLNNQDGSAILFSTNFTGIYDRALDIVAMGYRKSQGVMDSSVPLQISLPQSDKRSPLRLKTGIDSINAIVGIRGTENTWYVGNGLGSSSDVMLHDYIGGGMLRLGKDSISINKPLIIDGMYAYRNAIHSKGDFNSYTTNGRFWLVGDSLTANAPHANSGALTVDRYEGSTGPIILQTFEPYYSNSTYTRTYGAGVWSSWYERTAPSVNYYNSIKFQEIETIVGQDTAVVFPKAFPNKCLGVYVGMVSSVNPSTGAFYGGIECAQVYETYNGSCMVAGYEILSGKIQYQNVKVKLLAVGY